MHICAKPARLRSQFLDKFRLAFTTETATNIERRHMMFNSNLSVLLMLCNALLYIVVGILLHATTSFGEVVFNQVVFEMDSFFEVPYYEVSNTYDSFQTYDIDDVFIKIDYKGYHYGIHENGADLGVVLWLVFKDAEGDPAYESCAMVLLLPDTPEYGSLEIAANDEYTIYLMERTNHWKLTAMFEVAIDEYDHPFPKNPGFDKVLISVIVNGTFIQATNEYTSFGYIKKLYSCSR